MLSLPEYVVCQNTKNKTAIIYPFEKTCDQHNYDKSLPSLYFVYFGPMVVELHIHNMGQQMVEINNVKQTYCTMGRWSIFFAKQICPVCTK